MGLLTWLFGERKTLARGKPRTREEAQEIADRCLNGLAGVQGVASLSESGRPVCPRCGKEFPVSPEQMAQYHDAVLLFDCPRCRKRIRVR